MSTVGLQQLLLVVVVLLSCCWDTTQCLQCFTDNYSACNTSLNLNATDTVELFVVPKAGSDFLRAVTALSCHHETINTTYCWLESTTTTLDCDGHNCSAVTLTLIQDGQQIPAALLGNYLMREDTQLALLLNGYTIHRVVYTVSAVSDVPVASWVCLCVGTLLSGLMLSKLLCTTKQ